jgi:hypothetical protein
MPIPSAIAACEWAMSAGRPSISIDPPSGPVEAVQDRHQRALAGAVFADDAMHRARGHRQVHGAVGVHRAEALVDRPQRNRGAALRRRSWQ